MKTNDEWALFERLSDPELPAEERSRLEALIVADPVSQERYEAFLSLVEWPALDARLDTAPARSHVLNELARERETNGTDRELGRLFPMFIGTALAAVLVVALLNVMQFGDFSDGALEALFGLPAETMETAIVSQL